MPKKLTQEQYEKRVKEMYEERFEVLSEYKNSRKDVKIKCNTCGEVFNRNAGHVIHRELNCPKCNKYANTGRKHKEFVDEVREITNGNYEVISKFKTVDHKVKIRHNECGYVWRVNANSFLRGTRCPRCAKGGVKLSQEEFKRRKDEVDPEEEYTFLEKYQSYDSKILVIHNKCGNRYKVSPNKFLNLRGCPICNESKGERNIRQVLSKLGIEFETQKTFEGLRYDRDLKVDFYLPNLDLAVEYDGKQHFEPQRFSSSTSHEEAEESFKYTKKLDRIKDKYFNKVDTDLIRIPYKNFGKLEEIIERIVD